MPRTLRQGGGGGGGRGWARPQEGNLALAINLQNGTQIYDAIIVDVYLCRSSHSDVHVVSDNRQLVPN